MPKDLPATVPARVNQQVPAVSSQVVAPATKARTDPPSPAKLSRSVAAPAAPNMTIRRADLAVFVRFASRLAGRAPVPALRCCRFSFDSAVVTDLDVTLRGHVPGARDIGVLAA